MSKITLKFDKTSPLWSNNDGYNKLLINSQMSYLRDQFDADGLLLIKDVCDMFGISYTGLSIDDGDTPVTILTCYWMKPLNDTIDIEVIKNDDGSYTFVCDAND